MEPIHLKPWEGVLLVFFCVLGLVVTLNFLFPCRKSDNCSDSVEYNVDPW